PRTLSLDAGSTAFSASERALNLAENLLTPVISDSGLGSPTSVTKTGTGLWYLAGANTYTGATSINGGVLRINSIADGGSASSIGASSNAASNLNFADGATLQYIGSGHSTDRQFTLTGTNTFDASGSGPVAFTSTAAVSNIAVVFTGTNTGNNTFAPTITGATAVTKNGNGKWVLSGNNSYTGATAVNSGTLRLESSQTTTASVTIGAGATLQLAPNGTRVIKTGTLTVSSSGGKLDVTDNKLIVTGGAAGSSWNGTAYAGIAGLVQKGYNGGFQNGTGSVTTQSNAISP